jgi:hypothetical protein
VQSLALRFGLELPQPLSIDARDLTEAEAQLYQAWSRRSLCARLGSYLCCGCFCRPERSTATARRAGVGHDDDNDDDDNSTALAASELNDAHVRVIQQRCQSLFVAVEEAIQRCAVTSLVPLR